MIYLLQKFSVSFIKKELLLFILLAFVLPFSLPGQTIEDTSTVSTVVKEKKKGSVFSGRPGKALLLSLIVPGAGQIYSKSYLRVPFVWAAVGGAGYILVNNTRQYNCFREAYIDKIDMQPVTVPDYCFRNNGYVPFTRITKEQIENASAEIIRSRRDEANVNRQWAIIGFTLVWLANGVDAFVDAHLKDFDIDEDLSIDVRPHIDDDPFAPMRLGIYMKF